MSMGSPRKRNLPFFTTVTNLAVGVFPKPQVPPCCFAACLKEQTKICLWDSSLPPQVVVSLVFTLDFAAAAVKTASSRDLTLGLYKIIYSLPSFPFPEEEASPKFSVALKLYLTTDNQESYKVAKGFITLGE